MLPALLAVVRDLPLDPAPYKTLWFEQKLDHFQAASNATFMQRYLLNADNWDTGVGPILFYSGNEGPIDAFYAATGFVTDVLAPKLNALIIFAEQRYYGKTLPFGTKTWSSKDNLRYLSTEQVLADYALLLTSIKPGLNASGLPVVTFGGSYGGTLSTLFRIKYPHVVIGALAASAPLGYYSPSYWAERGVTEHTWFDTVVNDYATARPGCYAQLVRAVAIANATARDSAAGGGAVVANAFGLCAAPTEVDQFIYWITEALESIPQIDYPESIGSLPASPVNAACDAMAEAVALERSAAGDPTSVPLLGALGKVMGWYYGGSKIGCIPERLARNAQMDGGTPGDGPAPASSWGYQSCTETLHKFSTRAGAWRAYNFDLAALSSQCEQYYGVTPDMSWLETWSGGYAIGGASSGSNIIWSNGKRDPWHGGGFLRASDALPGGAVFVMEATAHHQDLRKPVSGDPAELVEVRAKEEAIIRGWIAKANAGR